MRRGPTGARRDRAFTLLEVTIAMAIGVIVLVVIDQVFVSGARTFTRGTRSAEAMVGAVLLLETMSSDLAQVWSDDAVAEMPFQGFSGSPIGAGAKFLFLDLATGKLSFKIAVPKGDSEDVEGQTVDYALEPAGAAGVSRVVRNGTALADVFVKQLTADFVPYGHPESSGIEYLRLNVVATDHQGMDDIAMTRLIALEVASAQTARKRAREAGRALRMGNE